MTARVDRQLVLDILVDARDVLVCGKWTQHGPAADASGRPMLDVHSAAAWSPIGALMLACSRRNVGWQDPTAWTALRALQVAVKRDDTRPRDQTVACVDISDANDELDAETGKSTAVAWFSTAIAAVTQSMPRAIRAVGGTR